MKQLKRSKKAVFNTLRYILRTYEGHKLIAQNPEYMHTDPIEKTLHNYDDFYEWLQGEN